MSRFDEPGYCEECGNRGVVRKVYDGQPIDECDLCGALYGEPDLIDKIETDREADSLGIDRGIYPLVEELNHIKGVRCYDSSEGDVELGIPPFVKMHITDQAAVPILGALMTSLSLSSRAMAGHWHIEVLHENGIIGFSLRPRRPPDESARRHGWIETARGDLIPLVKQLASHKRLAWWKV
ncbi:MAG: hypothetical protein AB7N65_22825 [Vicinamibacterales bacterium]